MKNLKSRLATFKADKQRMRLSGQPGLPRLTEFGRDWYRRQSKLFGMGGGTWGEPDKFDPSARAFNCNSFESCGLRHVGAAHEVLRTLRHTGWFCDVGQDNLSLGHVLQLPGRDGSPRFIPAFEFTHNDGVTLYPLDQYDNAEDCARVADGYAEAAAEREREYQERETARARLEDLQESIKATRRDCLQLLREWRTAPGLDHSPTIRGTIAAQVARYRASIAEARDEIDQLTAQGVSNE